MTNPVLPFQLLRSIVAGRRPGDGTIRAVLPGELFLNQADGVLCWADGNGALKAATIGDLATHADVAVAVAAVVATIEGGAPGALSTLKELADAIADNPSYAAAVTAALAARLRLDAGQGLTGAQQAQGLANLGALDARDGRCILKLVGSNLVLLPCDGNTVLVNGTLVTIPDAGLTLATTGLTVGTSYYIYLTAAGALEASTTAYVIQAGTGLKIKGPSATPDATRRLVGYAFCNTGTAWVDTPAFRGVRTYFNDPGVAVFAVLGSGGTNAQAYTATGLVGYLLAWAGERVETAIHGSWSVSIANHNVYQGLYFDGVGASYQIATFTNAGYDQGLASDYAIQVTEGLHNTQMYVALDSQATYSSTLSDGTITMRAQGSGA